MLNIFFSHAQLQNEIKSWVEEGIISSEQAESLYQKYQLDKLPWYRNSSFILSAVALILVSLGLILLISENWHRFNISIRSAIGLFPLLIAYGVGFYFLYKDRDQGAELAFFLGSIVFGINIFLQAQIFHIDNYFPDGFKWWLIGAIPVALYFRGNLHNFLLQILFFSWIRMLFMHGQFSWWSILLFLPIVYLWYLKPNRLQHFFTLINAFLLLMTGYFFLYPEPDESFLFFLFGTLALSSSLLAFYRHRFPFFFIRKLYESHLLLVLLAVFIFTFDLPIDHGISMDWISGIILGISLILGLWKSRYIPEWWWTLGLTVALYLLLYTVSSGTTAYVYLACNILFLAHAIWRIIYSIQHQYKYYFMSGIVMMLLLAIARFTDMEDYIIASIVFILGGILLLFLNNYWNKKYEIS